MTFEAALKIKDAGFKGKKETIKCFFSNKPGHLKKDSFLEGRSGKGRIQKRRIELIPVD